MLKRIFAIASVALMLCAFSPAANAQDKVQINMGQGVEAFLQACPEAEKGDFDPSHPEYVVYYHHRVKQLLGQPVEVCQYFFKHNMLYKIKFDFAHKSKQAADALLKEAINVYGPTAPFYNVDNALQNFVAYSWVDGGQVRVYSYMHNKKSNKISLSLSLIDPEYEHAGE